MKAAFAWSLFHLIGLTCCTSGAKTWPIWLETLDQVPDWWPLDIEKPDWFPNIPDLIPSNPEWIPWSLERYDWFREEYPERIKWPLEEPDGLNKVKRGTPTSVEEFPSLVQIEVGSGPIWAQGCAGSDLTSLHVLTSARCVSGRLYNNRFRRVRAGASKRFTDGIVVDVESVLIHPSFGEILENFFDGDIAIITLGSFLIFEPSVPQARIIHANFQVDGGWSVVHAGWGSTAKGNEISNHDLYKVDLVTIDHATCVDTWSRLIPISIVNVTNNMICVGQAQTGGRDSDLRDLGAPIYIDNIIVGIVSWGNPLGNQRFPVVATAVSTYTKWIVENAV